MPGRLAAINARASRNGKAAPKRADPAPAPAGSGDPLDDPPDVRDRIAAERRRVGRVLPSGDSDPPGAAAPAPPRPRFPFIGSAEFFATEYRVDWLLPGVLVKGQPAVIAGPSKGMKTSVAIDMAVSLAAGRPFLGKFPAPRRVRVAVVSGESGEGTIKETALRVAAARGIDPDGLDGYLDWCFTLPTFSDVAGMIEFGDELVKLNAELVVIDPFYLCLGDVDAKSLFEMGPALRIVSEILLKAGCTPAICHHANRMLKTGEPMELADLAYSGLEQFARQFLLLNRREKYQSDGVHDMWLRVGGSAGHGGLWGLHIEEGLTGGDGGGRHWDVGVLTPAELEEDVVNRRDAKRGEEEQRKRTASEGKVLGAIDVELRSGQAAATRSRIRGLTGLSDPKVKEITDSLIDDGCIEKVDFCKIGGHGSKQKAEGFRRVEDA